MSAAKLPGRLMKQMQRMSSRERERASTSPSSSPSEPAAFLGDGLAFDSDQQQYASSMGAPYPSPGTLARGHSTGGSWVDEADVQAAAAAGGGAGGSSQKRFFRRGGSKGGGVASMSSVEQEVSLQQVAEQVSSAGEAGDVAGFGRVLSDVEAAEVRQVKHELAEKDEELERVRERRDILASECEAVRVERDVLRRSQADMTERMAEMEGEVYRTRDMLAEKEQELQQLRSKQGGGEAMSNRSGSSGNDSIPESETVARLKGEVEQLAQQLRQAKAVAGLQVGGKAGGSSANGDEGEQQGWRRRAEEAEKRVREAEEVRQKVEDELAAALHRVQSLQVEQAKWEDERAWLGEARQELEGKLASLQAALSQSAVEASAAVDRAEAAEAGMREMRGGRGKEVNGEQWQQEQGHAVLLASLKTTVEELQDRVAVAEGRAAEAEERARQAESAAAVTTPRMSSSLSAARREKEAAVAAAERVIEGLRKQLAAGVAQVEAAIEAERRGKESEEMAGQYLKAMEVARVEVKKLRAERDLLMGKLHELEEASRTGNGMSGMNFLLPSCLLRTSPIGEHVPDE